MQRTLVACALLLGHATSQKLPETWLVTNGITRSGRSVIHTDAVEHALVTGTWRAPTAGASVEGSSAKWREARFDGTKIAMPSRGYAWCRVTGSKTADGKGGWYVLRAKGHGLVYVDGMPRVGDHYRMGTVVMPLLVREGGTELLFRAGRGRNLEVDLQPLEKSVFFTGQDTTMPHVRIDAPADEVYTGAVVVAGLYGRPTKLFLRTRGKSFVTTNASLPAIPHAGSRKVPVVFRPKPGASHGVHDLTVQLFRKHPRGDIILDGLDLKIPFRRTNELHERTFLSKVDGSVQYYAVQPSPEIGVGKALFLSLHGASVEARGQAAAYSPKSWGHVIAPTNRRPYGFDWEFIGRLDALEVLADAKRHFSIDPSAVYLTGHSMGGHGTWQVGVTHPSLFAAIGPSAGWCSFSTYTRRRRGAPKKRSAMQELLARAASPSDTLLRKFNYKQHGVYVLHGDKDRSVPVREAREMREALAPFHRDVSWYEREGAGHWWDGNDEPGADCVDWEPMFDFFARRRVPAADEVRTIDFSTVNPADSSTCHWVEILAQQTRLAVSRVQLRRDPQKRRIVGTTTNVEAFELRVGGDAPFRIELDGASFEATPSEAGTILLTRRHDDWITVAARDLRRQRPGQSGPFQQVFNRRFVFVYGTKGSPEENAWAMAKARFDAETLWYRGNGSVEILEDARYDDAVFAGRNVVLYGNAKTNSVWSKLLGDEVRVDDGAVQVGRAEAVRGKDLACVFVRPKPGSSRCLVAGIGGTGLVGMRLTDRFPYFVSGVHYPDVFVAKPKMLVDGHEGIVVAGFFGNDWSVEKGEFVWQR